MLNDRTIARFRRGRGSRAALAAVVVAGLLLAASPASAATTPYGVNLVKNPGAEAGPASSNGHAVVSVPSWQDDYGATVVKYGQSGGIFPSKSKGNAINGGDKFFSLGDFDSNFDNCGDFQQEWLIKGLGSDIDSGHVKVTLKARVATYADDPGVAHVDLYARKADNHPDGLSFTGFYKSTTGTHLNFQLLQGSHKLSKHTRLLRIHLYASDVSGGNCTQYFDKLSVVLTHV
jgi:hypothetical protein